MQRNALIIVTAALATLSCQTPSSRPAATGVADAPAPGYFVALAADGEAGAFYQRLYAVVDGYNRRLASDAGALDSYQQSVAADGRTRLADAQSEIECDREKCLVKVASRTLASADPTSLPAQLSRALGNAALTRDGLRIACADAAGKAASYRCTFDLGRGRVASAGLAGRVTTDSEKGKLVDCALAPGVARTAEEDRSDADEGGLLKLTASAGESTRSVGFLRYGRDAKGAVEFSDVYLCGDLSEDHFQVSGAAASPRAWLGGTVADLTQDEWTLAASSRVVDGTPSHVTVDVRFEVRGPGPVGADHFFLRLERGWLKP